MPSKDLVPSKGARTTLPDYEEIDMEIPPARTAGKRPALTRTESSTGNGYMAIQGASSSGLVEPNAIISRVSGQTGYMTWAERLPHGGRNKLSKMAEEKEVTGYITYATPGALHRMYARMAEERAATRVGGKWRIMGQDGDRVTWSDDAEMVV